jgi:hypothetical protein
MQASRTVKSKQQPHAVRSIISNICRFLTLRHVLHAFMFMGEGCPPATELLPTHPTESTTAIGKGRHVPADSLMHRQCRTVKSIKVAMGKPPLHKSEI